jgi:hypothetical protein
MSTCRRNRSAQGRQAGGHRARPAVPLDSIVEYALEQLAAEAITRKDF